MNQNIEYKIGFDRIRESVIAACTNALAVRMTEEMSFLTHYDKVMRELRQTEEMRQVLMLEPSFPSQDFLDLTEVLSHLKVEGTVIDLKDLFDLRCSLQSIVALLRFFADDEETRYPELKALASRVDIDASVAKQAATIVDDKGDMPDNASETLLDIRQQIRRKQSEVDSQISRSLSKAKKEGWAPDNAEATIRNGRMVIPMLDTHRRKIKGIIHDESATRQTAYLEPSEVVELNNDLRGLEFAERHEMQRILARFSDYIRPQLSALLNAYWFLARIDFIRAKARFALTLNAGLPIVDNETKMAWLDARHPLLYLNYLNYRPSEGRNRPNDVVPFNLSLHSEARMLIVSGPNAGGKSVCLKAVGLLQYMLQCGLLVPCRQTSEFGIFDRLFIDIGDQQSIDNDLSTYTSHLQNMKALLQEADSRTLFLLDELGGGTEPRSGCAIAEAVLEELYRRGSFGVITTHFADLKLLADRLPAVVNGAMLFDTERMVPLYRLAVGHPGSSFAFEIATNIGFPKAVLDAAAEKVGGEMLNFEHQLQQIEIDKEDLARRRTELEVSDAFLQEVVAKYQKLSDKLESKKHEIISEAREEARRILADANRTVEQTISAIKTAQAEKVRTQQAREQLRAETERIELAQERANEEQKQRRASRPKTAEPPKTAAESVAKGPIVSGDIVKIDGQETFGQVVEIKGKKAVVESNSIRMTIAIDRLTKTLKKGLPVDKTARQTNRFQSIFDEINDKRKEFNPTLDLRGQRVEDALVMLQGFLDDASLLGEKQLRILHGKGYGILKSVVREQLSGNKEVQTFGSERLELGGDGITVVQLR